MRRARRRYTTPAGMPAQIPFRSPLAPAAASIFRRSRVLRAYALLQHRLLPDGLFTLLAY